MKPRLIAAAAALAVAAGGGALALDRVASADTSRMSVTLQHSSDGASANISGSDVLLTVGTDSATTYARMWVNGDTSGDTIKGTPVPSSEPTFDTDHYTAGSPRWVIDLSNGNSLWGYPSESGLNGNSEAWSADNGKTYKSYQGAENAAGVTGSTTVNDAYIVADGEQAPGTTDALSNITYNGWSNPQEDAVTLTNPGSQTGQVGTAIQPLQLQASSNGGYPLTYGAANLPAGLSLDTSTGQITGTPTTAGTYQVTATATDATGAAQSQSFTWTISNAPPPNPVGKVTNAYSGLCLNDSGYSMSTGAPVIQWGCGSYPNEQYTFKVTGTDSSGNQVGELVSNYSGLCLNDAGYAGPGGKVIQWTCGNYANELWSYWTKYREYSLTLGSQTVCLNDPGWSTANGTQQIVWSCPDTANEQYTLPS